MDLLADLTEPQRRAVTHRDGPLLVLAGAGSGKTRVITRRVAWLIREGVAPWNIAAVTFTNKAAGEMRDRVAAITQTRGPVVGTFHSLCARLLREYAAEAGLDRNYTIYDVSDRRKLIKDATAKLELDSTAYSPASVEAIISRAKNELIGPEEFAGNALSLRDREIARIFRVYDEMLRAANGLDFDDLLMIPALLLKKKEELRAALEDRFRYVLIDEYQDTNHAQYAFVRALTRERRNLCVVGDPDQSIYAWRGADLNNILKFETDYPAAAVVRLEQNYRSTKTILAAADGLIARNLKRKPKALWTDNEAGPRVKVFRCTAEHQEAEQIAHLIADEIGRGAKPGDIAIFFRVNALTRVLENALRSAALPYEIVRGVEFYNRQEIKDALSYLRVLVNPADTVCLERILNVPPRGIGDTTLTRVAEFAESQGIPLLEGLRRVRETAALRSAAKVEDFLTLLDKLAPKPGESVRDVVDRVIMQSGLWQHYSADRDEEAGKIDNLNELINAAADFAEHNPEGTLADFLTQASLTSDQDGYDADGGKVTLMTLHAAKGLEFPVVIIAGLEQGMLPHERSISAGDVEEERRLFFVGITRAMKRLYLTHALYRSVRGESLRQLASDFLAELPPAAIEKVDLTYGFGGSDFDRSVVGGNDDDDDDSFDFGRKAEPPRRHWVTDDEAEGRTRPRPQSPLHRPEYRSRYDYHRTAGGGYRPPAPFRQESAGARSGPEESASSPLGAEGKGRGVSSGAGAAATGPGKSPPPSAYRVGMRVKHPTFGTGKIVSMDLSGSSPRVRIDFGSLGEKTIVLGYVRLEPA
jgi:DNA helicase-2/ATP-dependent DNA helicase PcrA